MNNTGAQFKVRLKILTPVHIGSGETINQLGYFLESGYFCRININSLFNSADIQPYLDKLLEPGILRQSIDRLIPKPILQKHLFYKLPLHNSARQTSATQEVHLFIKSAGRVYIPGSSLKGAILSALCYAKLKERNRNEIMEILQGEDRHRGQNRENKDLLELVLPRLGGRGAGKLGKFTHWLDVSDSDFQSPQDSLELVQVTVIGARRGGQIPILYETLKPDTQFTFTLKLDPASQLTPEALLNSVGQFYQRVLTKDKDRLMQGDARIPASVTLIRLGQGSGMFATSLLLLAQELNLTAHYRPSRIDSRSGPRTRKRITSGENIPLGWAEISIV